MTGESYDYYDEEDTKASGGDVVTPALIELERYKKTYDLLKEYIAFHGKNSNEMLKLRKEYPSDHYQNIFNNICNSIE